MTKDACSPASCTCQSAPAAGGEIHVAGVLVHARPERLDDVCLAVSLLPDAEVTHASGDGRAVVVLEAASGRAVMQQLEAIRAIAGVLNVAIVYQHAEPEEDMNQEMAA
ncbi:MAG TPA: chaperone NapD [Ramlibacter sp.]|nr:chaperone NapD [Ramlibacter sp.]